MIDKESLCLFPNEKKKRRNIITNGSCIILFVFHIIVGLYNNIA